MTTKAVRREHLWPHLAPTFDAVDPTRRTRRQALRNVAWFRENPLSLFGEVSRRGTGFAFFDVGVRMAAVASTAEAATAAFTNPDLDKDSRAFGPLGSFRGFSVLRDLVGPSLPALEDVPAKARRQWVLPAYSGAQRIWLDQAPHEGPARLRALLREHTVGGTTDLFRACSRFVFERACTVLFGNPYSEDSASTVEAIEQANISLDHVCSRWLPASLLVVTERHAALKRARATLLTLANKILDDLHQRSPNDDRPAAAFSLCDFNALTDVELADEILTQLVGGTESTSTTVAWTALQLARSPSLWRAAADDVATTPLEALRAGGLGRDGALPRSIREGLRLYPAFWQVTRVAQRETSVLGHVVPKDGLVFICSYLVHRDPEVYHNPEEFRPFRDAPTTRLPGHSITFGFGPRSCVGARLSQGIMLDTLRALLSLSPSPFVDVGAGPQDEIHPLIFGLKRKGGFPVQFAPGTLDAA